MYFLIGVIILIVFICFCYWYLKDKLKKIFGISNIGEIIKDARLEDQELPKSLSSMDSIYLEQIIDDFPELNINELKRVAEGILIDTFKAIEKCDSSSISVFKIKSFVDKKISENSRKKVKFNNFKIHKTVISNYERHLSSANIYFGISFEYILDSIKVQDRAKLEFIYVIDTLKYGTDKKELGLNCPNCGAPIKSLGNKMCTYCKTGVIDLPKKSWICNDLKLY